jgi:hypothetical protein
MQPPKPFDGRLHQSITPLILVSPWMIWSAFTTSQNGQDLDLDINAVANRISSALDVGSSQV